VALELVLGLVVAEEEGEVVDIVVVEAEVVPVVAAEEVVS
jgi:hypothetical protein